MPTLSTFRLPDAGEGLTEADIVTWRVKPGDVVAVNDPLVEIETAKSLVELPSPYAGTVRQLLVAEGDTVAVGAPIITIDTGSDSAGSGAQLPPVHESTSMDLVPEPAPERTPVLVGYGPRSGTVTRRRRPAGRAGGLAEDLVPALPGDPVRAEAAPVTAGPVTAGPVTAGPITAGPRSARVRAKPPVRKLARDLGVDLRSVPGTGPGGIVTRADVERLQRVSTAPVAEPEPGPLATAAGARETRIPIKGVRRSTAAAMVASAFSAPHVTEWVQVDVSRTVKLVDRLKADRAFEGVKVSPLVLVAKALLLAVRRHPEVNASWDGGAGEIVLKRYVNLGIAAATPRGLMVPNIKDADRLSLRELADALATLTADARAGRTPPSDLAGGTITITNVGVFGVDGGTPILNPGEAAILAVGAIRRLPWVHRGKVRPRWVTTLSLSFDHRLVDGDLGSGVLADVAALLERPALALIMS